MPGPSPKPTSLKVVEGNRGKRALNKQEPDPEYLEADSLAAPAWLDARATVVWNEMAPPLQKARLVAIIDVPLLAMCCVAIAQFRFAAEKVGDNPVRAAEGEKGEMLNPWLIVQSMSFKQATAILREFGVGPASRTRIALQPQMDLFNHGQGEKDSKYFAA
jgi:P27 family predicted phage terminase small subunit